METEEQRLRAAAHPRHEPEHSFSPVTHQSGDKNNDQSREPGGGSATVYDRAIAMNKWLAHFNEHRSNQVEDDF